MRADEARANVEKHKEKLKVPSISDIIGYIARTSREGASELYYGVDPRVDSSLLESIVSELTNLGYKVTNLDPSDQGLIKLHIEWK